MRLDGQVEHTQAIRPERVGATLQHNSRRSESRDGRLDHTAEQRHVCIVIDAIVERHVQAKMLALVQTRFRDGTGHGEEKVSILVKADGEDAIGAVKSLLYAVAVMDVDIDVEHPGVNTQQLENRKHNVVDVAKSARLALFRVMQAAAPIDGNVAGSSAHTSSCCKRRSGVLLKEAKHASERWTVVGTDTMRVNVALRQIARAIRIVVKAEWVGNAPARGMGAARKWSEDIAARKAEPGGGGRGCETGR